MAFKLGQKLIDKLRGKKNKGEEWFRECVKKYNSLNTTQRFVINDKDYYKIIGEDTATTDFDMHYEYHPAWAARIVKEINPKKHIDISSKITFNVMLSAFIPVDFYDYRPAKLYNLSGLECKAADLLNLPFEDNSVESISCMHVIEHIGLGRYGDEIDPEGDIKAINELKRVVQGGGSLLFVVPIGKPRLQYNAHRIYSYDMIMEYFKDFELANYSLIPDNGMEVGIINNATKELTDKQLMGCGCFWFKKK